MPTNKRTYILISGSRYLPDSFHKGKICELLKYLYETIGPGLTIIHGDCPKGIDAIIDFYCQQLSIDRILYPANWGKYNKQAGYIRNNLMMDHGKPDYVICIFSDLNKQSPGTSMTIRLAKKYNLPGYICDCNMLMSDMELIKEEMKEYL